MNRRQHSVSYLSITRIFYPHLYMHMYLDFNLSLILDFDLAIDLDLSPRQRCAPPNAVTAGCAWRRACVSVLTAGAARGAGRVSEHTRMDTSYALTHTQTYMHSHVNI